MITLVSVALYALAMFMASMMGYGMGRAKASGVDDDEANSLTALAIATILFFVMATALQVAA